MKVRKLLGGPPYEFWLGGNVKRKFWKPEFERIRTEEQVRPVLLFSDGNQQWWRFEGAIYRDDERLTAEDVHALLVQRGRKRDRQLQRARAELRGEATRTRERIPESVRHEVWRRDQGRCVVCSSQEKLEFDHIIPLSKGGANTARNIELRCEYHNREKGDRT